MKLADFIRDQFKNRLDTSGCLVIYDGEGRYRKSALASRRTRLIFGMLASLLGASIALSEGILGISRNSTDGSCDLIVTATNASVQVTFEPVSLLQYDPDQSKWIDRTSELPSGKKVRTISRKRSPVWVPITKRVGLLWLEWKEDGQTCSDFIHSGPALCNDLHLGPAPSPGLLPQCVPGTNSARAMFVSDPRTLKDRSGK